MKYVPGASNTFDFAVTVTTDGSAEFVDNIGFTFPAGVTVSSATGPSPFNFCGGGQGNYSNPSPESAVWATPGHPSGCGAFDAGTYNFSVTVDVPSNFSGNLTVVMQSRGDGWPPPLNDLQVTNVSLAYAEYLVAKPIPALPNWGLGLLGLLLAGASAFALRRAR